jgi:hypothetical protein
MKPTIESIEGKIWPEPDFKSSLILNTHALRKKPLDELTPNDLRLAFQEGVGADLLKEVVLGVLRREPAIDSVYFEGDLLLAVMRSTQFREDYVFRIEIIECADRALPHIFGAKTIDEIKHLRG